MKLLPVEDWWRWVRRSKTLIAACVLTGGEAAVAAGVPLPGVDLIPVPARGLAIAVLGGFALYFRIKAGQEKASG
jgi:hypothetical protein